MAKGHLDEPQKAEIVNKNTLLNKSQAINFIIEVVVTDRFHCSTVVLSVEYETWDTIGWCERKFPPFSEGPVRCTVSVLMEVNLPDAMAEQGGCERV